jgi:hypothetical protein
VVRLFAATDVAAALDFPAMIEPVGEGCAADLSRLDAVAVKSSPPGAIRRRRNS